MSKLNCETILCQKSYLRRNWLTLQAVIRLAVKKTSKFVEEKKVKVSNVFISLSNQYNCSVHYKSDYFSI